MLSETEVKKRAANLIAPIDQGELAIRIFEALTGMKRPAGKSVRELIEHLVGNTDLDVLAAAEAALIYFKECIDAGKVPS